MLNLERLRVLAAVARHESVNGAAAFLHVSPSAISQQITKLEREVGQTLVDREGRGIRLTNAGLLLAERAANVLDAVEALEGDLDEFRDLVAGPVRISAFATAARGLGPSLLLHLKQHHPELEASLWEQEPDVSLPLLASGDLDVVIAQDWFNAPLAVPTGIARMGLFDDTADIALPSGHRLARRRSVSLDDLAHERWVTWPQGSICHEWLVHTYRSRGIEPTIAHMASEHATQIALVGAGLGPAVIPRLGRGPVPNNVKMVRVDPALQRHVFAAWRPNTGRRSNVAAVRDALSVLVLKRQKGADQ